MDDRWLIILIGIVAAWRLLYQLDVFYWLAKLIKSGQQVIKKVKNKPIS